MADAALQKFQLAGLARARQDALSVGQWGASPKGPEAEDTGPSKEVLEKLIEAEIIPRLMLAHRAGAQRPERPSAERSAGSRSGFTAEDVDAFARQTVEADPDVVVEAVMGLLHEGVSYEDVLLRLLAPAARRLGEYWDEDSADFADVTLGLMKLQRVLECVSADAPVGMGAGANAPSILLTPAPGDQHVFGLVIVGEFFSRSGWCVQCEPSAQSDHLLATVAERHFDVVGLSASSQISVKALQALLQRIRTASHNPAIVIMVGGQQFNEDPALVRRVGADAMANDGVRAVVAAERLIHKLTRAEGALQQ